MRRTVVASSVIVVTAGVLVTLEAASNAVGMHVAYRNFDDLNQSDPDHPSCLEAAELTLIFARKLRHSIYWPLLSPRMRRTVEYLLRDEPDLGHAADVARMSREAAREFVAPH